MAESVGPCKKPTCTGTEYRGSFSIACDECAPDYFKPCAWCGVTFIDCRCDGRGHPNFYPVVPWETSAQGHDGYPCPAGTVPNQPSLPPAPPPKPEHQPIPGEDDFKTAMLKAGFKETIVGAGSITYQAEPDARWAGLETKVSPVVKEGEPVGMNVEVSGPTKLVQEFIDAVLENADQ